MIEKLEEPGISLIASYLRSKSHDVTLINCNAEPDCNSFLAYKPDIIGMNMYNASRKAVINIAKNIKGIAPNIFITVGGVEPTYYGKEIMEEANSAIDFIIRGEGEIVFANLTDEINTNRTFENIKGLTYRENNKIIENDNMPFIDNLDTMPYAARDLLIKDNLAVAQISTSRGCIGNCTFCSSPTFWHKWRGRSAGNAFGEIEELSKNGITMFNFIDSSFEDPDQTLSRMEGIIERIIEKKLKISYFADFRADFHKKVSNELMEKVRDSGLCAAMIGIESNNEYDLKLYGKKATLSDNKKTIALFKKYDIPVKIGFINFNPYSTIDGLKENVEFLKSLSLAASVESLASELMVYKNTPLYKKVINDNLFLEEINGEIKYAYINPNIKQLCDFVNKYMRQENEIGYIFNEFKFFCIYYSIMIKNLKLQFRNDHNVAAKFLCDFESLQNAKIENIINDINEKIYQWFILLLNIADNGWNVAKATEVTEKHLHLDDLRNSVKELNRIKRTLYIGIIKIDAGYEAFLLSNLNL